jgi:RNA polymerase sigma-70 factor (ECF subfamily)
MEVFSRIDAKTEAELVARVRAGDERAEEELYVRYKRGVAIIISQATNDSSSVPDLCQETFRITLQRIKQGKLREPEKLPAFIWKVAQNLVIDHFRRLRAGSYTDIEDAEHISDPRPTQLESLLQKEKAAGILRALDEMSSERDRQVLYRFYILEESKKEICADLGLTSLQFNLVIFRARKQYKKLYEKIVGKLH